MFHRKGKITQEEHDRAAAQFYKLGYQHGQMAERNRAFGYNYDPPLTFAEKQVLVILEKEAF